MKRDLDLIVIGGGTSGMAAAIFAAMNQMKVTVFDAAGEDFDKPCGEGLMPNALDGLKRLGVSVDIFAQSFRLSGIEFFMPDGRTSLARFQPGRPGVGVQRKVLRKAMWTRARQLGVEIVTTSVESVACNNNCFSVLDRESSWLCVGTGSRGALLKQFGAQDKVSRAKRSSRYGVRRHARMIPWSPNVEVYWSDCFEVYVTPVGASMINIALLSWIPVKLEDAIDKIPILARRLEGVVWDDALAGVAPLRHEASVVQKGGLFVLGDAAGFLDAMTGEGNALAVDSGIAAVEAMLSGEPKSYPMRRRRLIAKYWFLTSWAVWFTRPGPMRSLVMKIPIIFSGFFKLLVR